MFNFKFYLKKRSVKIVYLFVMIYAILGLCSLDLMKGFVIESPEKLEFNYVYHQWFNSIRVIIFSCIPLFLILLNPVISSYNKIYFVIRNVSSERVFWNYFKMILSVTILFVTFIDLLYILGLIIYNQLHNLSFYNLIIIYFNQLLVYLEIALIYLIAIVITNRNSISLIITYLFVITLYGINTSMRSDFFLPIISWINNYYFEEKEMWQIVASISLFITLAIISYWLIDGKEWIGENSNYKSNKNETKGNKYE